MSVLHWVRFALYRLLPPLMVLALLCVLAFNVDSTCTLPNLVTGTWSVPTEDCRYCKEMKKHRLFQEKSNVSIAYFMNNFAFGSGPVLFKGASKSWPATNKFSYDFFRDLYLEHIKKNPPLTTENNGNDKGSEQYFSYRSSLFTVQEFLSLSETESGMNSSWYISWSVADPFMSKEIGHYLRHPSFLPPKSLDFNTHNSVLYIGTPGPAASLHSDYFGMLTWQAQLSGTKTWNLVPMPECDEVCSPLNITVEQGDIIVLDTHRWYHATYVHEGATSISYGVEFT